MWGFIILLLLLFFDFFKFMEQWKNVITKKIRGGRRLQKCDYDDDEDDDDNLTRVE